MKQLIESIGEASTFSLAPSPVLIGMPQLSLRGLSENWLLKEGGHRHWMALAHAFGKPIPDFRDERGNRLYAAFLAYRMTDRGIDTISENETVVFETTLSRVSRSQCLSRHLLRHRGRTVLSMEFLSTFLGRAILGSNRSVKRSVPLDFGQTSIAASRSELAETAHSMRAGNWTTHQGFSRQEAVAGPEFCCRPCPSNDFNGAEFLYFASFQALTDRAEWAMGLTPPNTLARPGYREIYYYGNIDVGEEIRIVLQKTRTGPQAQSLDHWCRVYRKSDGKIIADVFTGKALQTLSDLGPKSEALDECH